MLEDFTTSKAAKGVAATQAYVSTDGSFLYLAFRCEETHQDSLVTKTIADEKDGAVWQDDSIEVFLDPGKTGRVIYHLISNSEGTYYDAAIVDLKSNASAWSSEAQIRTGETADGWELEIALPLTSLRHLLKQGEVIGINLARNRYAGGGEHPERSSIAQGQYRSPERFLPLLVGGPVALPGGGTLVTTKAGPFLQGEGGSWEFEVSLKEGEKQPLELSFGGSGPRRIETRMLKGGRSLVSIPFSADEAKQMQQCEVVSEKRSLVQYAFEIIAPPVIERIARTVAPVFEPLLEPYPEGLARHGYLLWMHQLPQSQPRLPDFWLRSAEGQTNERVAQWFKEEGAIRLLRASWYRTKLPDRVIQRERYQKKGVGAMVYLRLDPHLIPKEVPIGISHAQPWYLDPRLRPVVLEQVASLLEASKEFKDIQGLFAGDEVWEVMHRNLLHFLDQRETYPELDAIDAEIRQRYGFGQYGLPLSSTDTNPFRWIATRRWEIDQMISLMAEIKAMMGEKAPHLKFLSWDNISGHRPYGLHRWGEVFDIVTGQLYPAQQPERQVFTFLGDWFCDLTGSREFWPVPHFEHYAANFTQEETEELLSQTFRGGATGLHLYLGDTVGARRGSANPVEDITGAPERWAVASSVIKRLRQEPFRVKRATADTGIFYSNTSYAGQGVGSGRALMYTNEVEWIYTLLGPTLEGAIRFFDERIASEHAPVLALMKTLYLPYGPIMDDAEHDALEAFVRKGGTLVICDPLAFSYRSDGSQRLKSELLPQRLSSEEGAPQTLQTSRGGGQLPAVNVSYPLKSLPKSTVLASYIDGGIAVLSRKLGKGTLITFGTNPLVERTLKEKAWIEFLAQLQKDAGALTKDQRWNFRFPSVRLEERPRPAVLCLSGNYFEWSYSEVKERFNHQGGGSYQLSRSPKGGCEPVGKAINFSKGRLTDRVRGARAKDEAKGEDFVLSWTGHEPLDIEWTFHQEVRASCVRLFYQGHLPPGRCEVFDPLKEQWQEVARWEAPPPLEDVGLEVLTVSFPKQRAQRLRLRLEPEAGMPWRMAEVEWWGE